MIIKNIKIRNYKTYLSLDLDLSVQSDRPIILIGGMNGGGKTTLFEAICGALYGLKIKDKDHFKELLNNGAVGTVKPEISLELTFEGLVLGQRKKYILKRAYILNPSEMPVESVSLNMDGTPFVYGTATPMAIRAEQEQQVNKIIKANLPQELSKYFLFDAMQSSELLKENVFAQIIKENIESVMGFNKYLQLKRAAQHVQQEWAARRLEAQQEQDEYNSLVAQKNELETLQDVNIAEQDKCYKLIVAMQESYDTAKEGVKNDTETQRKIDELETSITETNDLATRYNSQLKSVVDTLELNVFFPKLAESIAPEVDEILRQKKALSQEQEGLLSLDQIKEVTAKIISYMKSRVLCPQDVDADEIVNYVQRTQKQLESVDNYSFLDDSELEALQDLIKANAVNEFVALGRLHKDVETRLDLLENQARQVNILRGSLIGGNATIIKEFEDAKQRLDVLKKEYTEREGLIRKLDRHIHSIDVQIQQEPDIKYDTLVALRTFFNDVVNSLLRRKKEKIEEDMREQLNKLLISYKGYISRVELSDSMQDFNIRLYHKSGNEISLNQLNAASKQIFIQVLLKVLRNLGDYNPPVMIDTVMGVLDEESRDVLMEEYFPSLADQTILLCTTSEIRKESDYKKIACFVSRSYTLKRNIEAQNTTVEDGYFGIQLCD